MQSSALRNRTNAKLRYARLHIDELRNQPAGRGHDFERAHQEATLAQLFGAYAALLQELNVYLGSNLAHEGVTLGKIRNALKERGQNNPFIAELYGLEKSQSSWLKHAKDMRDYSIHLSGIPLAHYPQDGITALKNPKTSEEIPGDATDTLLFFITEMENLVQRCRHANGANMGSIAV